MPFDNEQSKRLKETCLINSTSFSYKGKKYGIDKVVEIEPDAGNKRFQITTKDKKVFILTYKESIFKWVLTESK